MPASVTHYRPLKTADVFLRPGPGTAVFADMLGMMLFGIFLTPVFYYVIQWMRSGAGDAANLPRASVHRLRRRLDLRLWAVQSLGVIENSTALRTPAQRAVNAVEPATRPRMAAAPCNGLA
jgi:hypothetical protein